MTNTIHIILLIFAFLLGWCFSEAYLIGPKKHYKRGYEAAQREMIQQYI
jgi:hypothetical protein